MSQASEQIAGQTDTNYYNYNRIKSFNDVGFYLITYVNEGGVVTKNITYNNKVDVTAISASINNHVLAREGKSFQTAIPNTIYYLDFYKDGDFKWGTSHPTGTAGTDYLTLAEVTTDSNGNVSTITDNAGDRGGFRLKPGYEFPEIAELQADNALLKEEWVNFRGAGGVADGVTSNVTALTQLSTDGKKLIIFPQSSNNIYLFNGALLASTTEGMTWDVAPGVSISVLDVGYLHHTLKVVRPTRVILTAFKREFWLTPARGYASAFRPTILAQSEIDSSVTEPIVLNAATPPLTYRDVTWPTGDTFGTFTPTSISVSGVQFNPPADGKFHVAFRDTKPGEEVTMQFTGLQNGNVLICAMVRTTTGYHGIYVATATDSIPDYFDKYAGETAVTGAISYPGVSTHASYAGYLSLWTIRVNSLNNFSILFNGMEVLGNKTITGEIIEVGFGTFWVSGTPMITLQDWVVTKNTKQGGKTPIRLAIFGDSRSAKEMPDTWPNWLRAYLDGWNGMRVHEITNYAVSGDSIAAQAALCTGANIANADSVIIDLGTNDIQAGTSETTYATTLEGMITTCQTYGKEVIIGVPDLFYGRDQAGAGVGQDTVGYYLGRGIRAKCIRTAADKGCKVVNKMEALGPIVSNYINASIEGSYASLDLDPIVFDSIHETAFGHQLIAAAYARAIAGVVTTRSKINKEPTLLPATGLLNGWTIAGDSPKWRRDASGEVSLVGLFYAGTIADGTIMYTLDENIRPTQTVRIPCIATGNVFAMVNIDPNGEMSVYGLPVGATWIDISNVSFSTRISL